MAGQLMDSLDAAGAEEVAVRVLQPRDYDTYLELGHLASVATPEQADAGAVPLVHEAEVADSSLRRARLAAVRAAGGALHSDVSKQPAL